MTSEASSVEIRLDAHSRGVTSRCTGLTAMVSMAAGSSRMRRAPMSAVIADPLYWLDPASGHYEKLTPAVYGDITAGSVKF